MSTILVCHFLISMGNIQSVMVEFIKARVDILMPKVFMCNQIDCAEQYHIMHRFALLHVYIMYLQECEIIKALRRK